ncbi:uncharacterized protein TNCV_3016651 [Trichonephila clavipes]|nr:uncharacterized protein TNCV_3016651 [Trichonephila clavipes]
MLVLSCEVSCGYHSIDDTVHVRINSLVSREEFLMDHGLGGPPNGSENLLWIKIFIWGFVSQVRFYATTMLFTCDCHPIFNQSLDTMQEWISNLTLLWRFTDLQELLTCSSVRACDTHISSFSTMPIVTKCGGREPVVLQIIQIPVTVPLTSIKSRVSAVNGPHSTALDDWHQIYGQSLYCRYETWQTIYGLIAHLSSPRLDIYDEAHFWLNGYVNKQNCRIWSEANPQVYVGTPLHPEKLTVWCALWAGGILLQKR